MEMDTENTKQRAPPPPYTAEALPEHSAAPGPSTHFNPPYPQPNVFPGSQPITVQPAATMHIVQNVPMQFGTKSQFVRCQNCGAETMTKTESKPTTTTHLIAMVLCCLILWPIAWLPYVCKSCQSTHHYCSNCNQFLGERHV